MALANRLKTKLTGWTARKLVKRTAWLAGKRPVASITFDDFPQSAWREGGPVLARYRARGTYFTAGGFCGSVRGGIKFYDRDDLSALAAAGHEIGCHGFGHQPAPVLSDAELAEDTSRNAAFLKPFLKGEAPVSHAYPFGQVSPRIKRFYASRFASVRGTHAGVNIGQIDLAQLDTISLEARLWDQDGIEAAIQRVLQNKGWLILYTHDISETPSGYGSTPGMLDWALKRVAGAGIAILPMREALPVALGF